MQLLPTLLKFNQLRNTHDGIPNVDFMADCPSCGEHLYLSFQIGDLSRQTPSDTGDLLRLITCRGCGLALWAVSGRCAIEKFRMCSVATDHQMTPLYVVYGLQDGSWYAANESGDLASEDSSVELFSRLDGLFPFGDEENSNATP